MDIYANNTDATQATYQGYDITPSQLYTMAVSSASDAVKAMQALGITPEQWNSNPGGYASSYGYNIKQNINQGFPQTSDSIQPASAPTPTASPVSSTPTAPPTTPPVSSTVPTTIGGVDITTLPPELQQTLTSIQTYLQKLQANGQVVNPNIQLTPEKVAEFTAQAQSEINPYYATQLKLARENLLASAGYSTNEIQLNEQKLAKQYNINFQKIGADAADQGFAQSGARTRDEGTLATDTQDTIDSGRRQLSFNLGNTERQFAQQYGGSNVPDLQIGNAPTATGGEPTLKSGTGTRSLYTLDPAIYDGLVGSQEYQQKADVTNRVSQLTGAFNANAALEQQRSLTL